MGSSDMGNVSQKTASIHPYIKICKEGISNHTLEFKNAARSMFALKQMKLATKAMALTAYDLFSNPPALRQVKREFKNWEINKKRGKEVL